ncbi:protein-glutamate O-methyltransferase CheR [Wenzhouxiangella sp. AB-CW3]|nr:protein-glutamate O-methyltransferase CheR [Wenzhouxiangella sp. AB-CW3]
MPALTDSEFELFRKLMYETAGINLSPAKRALVAGRLSKRLRELGHHSFREYFQWISDATPNSAGRVERQLAIDLLTTNETYFFRENNHFDFLRQEILPQWQNRRVRMWSAACSSGEEAYTLAMIMTLDGRCDWEILGTDISTRVVEKARMGVYPMERAEKIPQRYLKACCLKGVGAKAGQFMIDRTIRQKVRFQTGNLMNDQSSLGRFDLVLLRNVLIYFDPEVKRRVVRNVLSRLVPGGWLFVGHAESLNGVVDNIRLVRPSIYRKED